MSDFSLTAEAAANKAKKQGFEVVYADDNHLLLDLDDTSDRTFFENQFHLLNDGVVEDRWLSKSGKGEHVVIRLDSPRGIRDRIILQACLGSDRKREMIALLKYVDGGISNGIMLFKPKS